MSEYYPKRNIFMPHKMLEALQQDAARFEAFTMNGKLIMNRFLTQLLLGYYNDYTKERHKQAEAIKEQLRDCIKDVYTLNEKTALLLDSLSPRARDISKKEKLERVSYKPVTETNPIIYEIENENAYDGTSLSLSQYLRNMFASYLSLPIYERERIIFKDTVETLEEAIQKKQPVILSAIANPGKLYRVLPYKMEHSNEELFNYLLFQSHNDTLNKDTPFTMRLCRIHKPTIVSGTDTIQPEIQHLLDLMIKRTPQYAIYQDEITCVQLTQNGVRTFNRIYFGRPTPLDDPPIEELPDGHYKYYFNHSRDQLLFYFRRFEKDDAIVLYPKELADKIKAFHEDAWKAYVASECRK